MLLDQILLYVPCPIFWKNLDGVFLGGNKLFLEAVAGFHDYSQLIGKSDAELPWRKYKDDYAKDDQHVMNTGTTITRIESIPLNGRIIISETTKTPLIQDGEIIGVLGICLDITDRTEKEKLILESQAHHIEKQQQENFRKIVEQVVHDIRSPIATMQMMLPSCDVLPENMRVTLNKSASRIQDIANNLLAQFRPEENDTSLVNVENQRCPTLISAEILEIIAEKRYEYSKLSVDFINNISQDGYFAFINVDVRAFRRMLSNIINNAVDAINDKSGIVTVSLSLSGNSVQIIIEDNGHGMPTSVKEKLLNSIRVTSGKASGYGIGFGQIVDTLSSNEGKISIESVLNQFTKIILTFPQIETPNWICSSIELHDDDLIVILDDDPSIHGAWKTKFDRLYTKIKLKHFESGADAIQFLNRLSETQKNHVLLLTDYELLKQDVNGLDVVKNTKVSRSILVTSHHNNEALRELAGLSNTKILPKPLASELLIVMSDVIGGNDDHDINSISNASLTPHDNCSKEVKEVDLVIIDDDKFLVDALVNYLSNDKNVDMYYTVKDFLDDLDSYPKSTKMLIDNQFKEEKITGIELAVKLHESGFTNLYLFSGTDFSNDKTIPDYLTTILKTDTDKIKSLLVRV